MVFFSNIIENEETKQRLGKAILENAFPHAFIIEGPRGSGKHTLVTTLAAALNCEKRSAARFPCMTCNNCRRIFNRNFVDFGFRGRRDGKSSIGVEEIRALREDTYLSATESKYKIYAIEDADTITPQAQNALLKIFEEPPSGVIIFLLCENVQHLLSTIRSRAQAVRMQLLSDEAVKAALRSDPSYASYETGQSEAFTAAVKLAQGSIGRAKELLGEGLSAEITEARECALRIFSLLPPTKDKLPLYNAISALPQKRTDFSYTVRMVIDGLRDLIVSKYAEKMQLLFYTDSKDAEALAYKIGHARLLRFYDAFLAALEKCELNGNMNAVTTELCSIAIKI